MPSGGPTYRGNLPYTDEPVERLINSALAWDAAQGIGTLRTMGGLSIPAYDYVSMTLSPATTETYIFKTGGASGSVVATVVVVYTDATLSTLSSVTKT